MPRISDQFELVVNKQVIDVKIMPPCSGTLSVLFTVDGVVFGMVEKTDGSWARKWRARTCRHGTEWFGGQTRQQAVTSCVMSVLKKAGV
jgi:hypothetical protein